MALPLTAAKLRAVTPSERRRVCASGAERAPLDHPRPK
jgi:hypothetical protein